MTIKISQLGNLASFTGNTLFPVVNTANAYVTVKSTGATLLNYIAGNLTALSVSGNITASGYVNAAYFTGNGSALTGMNQYSNVQVATYLPTYLPTYSGYISGTLSTATQANVTTLGTLTTLVTSGNAVVAGTVFANTISTDLYIEDVNYANVGAGVTNITLSSLISQNILLIFNTDNPTANIAMPASPTGGQVCRISANANVTLALGSGTVSPTFAGGNVLYGQSLKYIYSSQYARWFKS
jgi:hypothetical protein